MQIIEKIALITINETMIVVVVSFLIFLYIMNRIMFQPLKKVMGDREDYIENLKQTVLDIEKEIAHLADQLAEREAAARQEALVTKKDVEEQGRGSAAEIQQAARDEVLAISSKNLEEVRAQITEARQHIQGEAEALVTGIMENVLNRRLA